MAIAKVILNGVTQMDVTQKTVTAGTMLNGATALKNDGTDITGNIASKSSTDLTVSGATVTAPAGYYSSNASKSVSSMTLPSSPATSSSGTSKATISRSTSTRYLNIPTGYNSTAQYYTISAVANGTVTAPSSISGTSATVSTGTNTLTLSKTVSVTPSVTTAGYISSGTAGNSTVSLTASVNTRSSSDLTVSGDTVTAPAGYYSISASKAVASGTAGTPTATKGTVSNHSISVTPSVTNTTGYITGSTKTGTAVTVSASELVSGSQTLSSNGTYDVTNLASVLVSASASAEAKMGALRHDAEKVKTWSVDRKIVEDDGINIPSYSTVSATLKSMQSFSETYQLDFATYDYVYINRMLCTHIYSDASNPTTGSGRIEYNFAVGCYELINYPATAYFGNASTSSPATVIHEMTSHRSVYWLSATTINTQTFTTQSGVYMTPLNPILSVYNDNVTMLTARCPSVYIKGDSSYFKSTYWNLLTDARYQYIGELWRVAKGTIDGFLCSSQTMHVVDCANSSTGTLT